MAHTIPSFADDPKRKQTRALGLANAGKTPRLDHGYYGSPTYRTYRAMHQRCYYPATDNYQHYGGRGITVCPEWHDFTRFLKDMGERPSLDGKLLTLDRIDGDGHYCKTNCRWATHAEQQANRRDNQPIELFGFSDSFEPSKELVLIVAQELGIPLSNKAKLTRLMKGYGL